MLLEGLLRNLTISDDNFSFTSIDWTKMTDIAVQL